ncbi:MAG: hypothetical protein DDT26_01970 [Dehalococcoidia bacterium]|nr:hypothetical protein [Chloroflexota bacterium]MBT9166199.1 hypothetical protein [Chloroflexota bacterium]
MIIDSRDLTPDTDLSVYSMEQLMVARGQIEETIEVIRAQIEAAKATSDEAELIASDWYRRCRGALRFNLAIRDRLAGRIRQLDGEIRRSRQGVIEREFINIAHDVLPDNLFTEIFSKAQEAAKTVKEIPGLAV